MRSDPVQATVSVMLVDGQWVARTAALSAQGVGATPTEAVTRLIEHDGFAPGVTAWVENEQQRRERDAQLLEEIDQAKKRRQRRQDAERRASNVIRLSTFR